MAFSKKTWLDRIAEYPTRRRLKKSDGTDEIVSVSREEGAISQEGDAFSAANMNDLEDRVASEFNSLNIKMESVRSHVGMIIQSTTLDTEAKAVLPGRRLRDGSCSELHLPMPSMLLEVKQHIN